MMLHLRTAFAGLLIAAALAGTGTAAADAAGHEVMAFNPQASMGPAHCARHGNTIAFLRLDNRYSRRTVDFAMARIKDGNDPRFGYTRVDPRSLATMRVGVQPGHTLAVSVEWADAPLVNRTIRSLPCATAQLGRTVKRTAQVRIANPAHHARRFTVDTDTGSGWQRTFLRVPAHKSRTVGVGVAAHGTHVTVRAPRGRVLLNRVARRR